MKDVLLMFSGGRDSILSAIRLVKDGYHVKMTSFDNGHIDQVSLFRRAAQRVIKLLGEDKCEFLGIYKTAPTVSDYLKEYMTESSISCPFLHCACISCHTAMFTHAIILCKQQGIRFIATGGRHTDPYMIGCNVAEAYYTQLCMLNGIKLLHPVEDIESNFDRKIEIAEAGLHPKTYEPQCWLGYAPDHMPTNKEINSAMTIFLDKIALKVNKKIQSA